MSYGDSSMPSPEGLDPAWQDFLRQKVNSFIKWDLVRFFHDNAHAADTAENIATVVGRDAETTRRELDSLAHAGVLEIEKISNSVIYRLSSDPEMRVLIRDFMAACHDRDFRVKAINQVIEGMGFTPHHDF